MTANNVQTLGELKSATILGQLQFKVQFDIWPIIFFDAQNKITKDSKPSFWLKQKYCCVQLCKSRVVSGEVLSGTRVQGLSGLQMSPWQKGKSFTVFAIG